MRKLVVFNSVTVDGYFTDANGDISWAKENQDAEFQEFVAGNASGGGMLLFGRITYDMMVKAEEVSDHFNVKLIVRLKRTSTGFPSR